MFFVVFSIAKILESYKDIIVVYCFWLEHILKYRRNSVVKMFYDKNRFLLMCTSTISRYWDHSLSFMFGDSLSTFYYHLYWNDCLSIVIPFKSVKKLWFI